MPTQVATVDSISTALRGGLADDDCFFETSDGYLVVVYMMPTTGNVSISVSGDNGQTWSQSTIMSSYVSVKPYLDADNNLYLVGAVSDGASGYNGRLYKSTYAGSGVWGTAVDKGLFYTGGDLYTRQLVKIGTTIHMLIREYDWVGGTWGDVKHATSTDDGSTWSSFSTIKSSGGDPWTGYSAHFVFRGSTLTVVYGLSNALGLKEWSGSSWGSEHSVSISDWGMEFAGSIDIGGTLYIISSTAVYPKSLKLTSWNGSSFSTVKTLLPAHSITTSIGTDGTDVFFVSTIQEKFSGTEKRVGYILGKYDISAGKVSYSQEIYSADTPDYAYTIRLLKNYSGTEGQLMVFTNQESTTKQISFIRYTNQYALKITKAGYEVNTETNPQNMIMNSNEPCLKIVASGQQTFNIASGANQTFTIAHSVPTPFSVRVFVYHDGLSKYKEATPTSTANYWSDYLFSTVEYDEDNIYVNISNNTGAARNSHFYYFINYT